MTDIAQIDALPLAAQPAPLPARPHVLLIAGCGDLDAERSAIARAIYAAGGVPVGAELAEAPEAWPLVEALMDGVQQVVIALGGCYGVADPETELSVAERAARVAQARGLPVLALLHGAPSRLPAERRDQAGAAQSKLKRLRKLLRGGAHKTWRTLDALSAAVAAHFAEGAALIPTPRPQAALPAQPTSAQMSFDAQDRHATGPDGVSLGDAAAWPIIGPLPEEERTRLHSIIRNVDAVYDELVALRRDPARIDAALTRRMERGLLPALSELRATAKEIAH